MMIQKLKIQGETGRDSQLIQYTKTKLKKKSKEKLLFVFHLALFGCITLKSPYLSQLTQKKFANEWMSM